MGGGFANTPTHTNNKQFFNVKLDKHADWLVQKQVRQNIKNQEKEARKVDKNVKK